MQVVNSVSPKDHTVKPVGLVSPELPMLSESSLVGELRASVMTPVDRRASAAGDRSLY